jgi:hypothetical protein
MVVYQLEVYDGCHSRATVGMYESVVKACEAAYAWLIEQGVDENDISVRKALDQSWISFEVLDDDVSADICTWVVE